MMGNLHAETVQYNFNLDSVTVSQVKCVFINLCCLTWKPHPSVMLGVLTCAAHLKLSTRGGRYTALFVRVLAHCTQEECVRLK